MTMGELPPAARNGVPPSSGAHSEVTAETMPSAPVRGRFEVVSVEHAPVPDGGQGTDWCRYVLSCGGSRITGLHRGTLDEVAAFAAGCAEDFNRRSATGRGTSAVAYAKRKVPAQG